MRYCSCTDCDANRHRSGYYARTGAWWLGMLGFALAATCGYVCGFDSALEKYRVDF
jgi:hypothetical protein